MVPKKVAGVGGVLCSWKVSKATADVSALSGVEDKACG